MEEIKLILTCLVQLEQVTQGKKAGGDEDRKWLLMQTQTCLPICLYLHGGARGGGTHSDLSRPAWGVGAHAHSLVLGSSGRTNGDRRVCPGIQKTTFPGTASSEQVPTGLFTSLHLVSVSPFYQPVKSLALWVLSRQSHVSP